MTGTSPAATTLTPESSEQPRETRAGIPIEDREAFIVGNAGVLLKDNALYQRTKVSSPELASLAAKYLNMADGELHTYLMNQSIEVRAEIKRLAASVLAQAEGSPRK